MLSVEFRNRPLLSQNLPRIAWKRDRVHRVCVIGRIAVVGDFMQHSEVHVQNGARPMIRAYRNYRLGKSRDVVIENRDVNE
jgi:hypothetical protein